MIYISRQLAAPAFAATLFRKLKYGMGCLFDAKENYVCRDEKSRTRLFETG